MAILTKEQISDLQKMFEGMFLASEQAKELTMISRQAFDCRLNEQSRSLLAQNVFNVQKNEVWTLHNKQGCLTVTKFVRSNLLGFTRVFEWFFVESAPCVKVSIRAVKIDDVVSADNAPYDMVEEAKALQCSLQQRKTSVFAYLLSIMR